MQQYWNDFVGAVEYYGPKILMAVGILLAFYIGAMIVKWLIGKAIDSTGLAKKANAQTEAGSKSLGASLANAAFWIVMLIGIVQAFAALGATQVTDALDKVVQPIVAYLPNIAGAVIIFGVFMIIANVIKTAMKAIFTPADVLPEKFGLASGPTNISGISATVLSAIVMILGAIAAFDALNIDSISVPANEMLSDVMSAIPRILIAGVILTIFVFIARFVADLIKKTLPGFGIDSAVAELGVLKGADKGMSASGVIANAAMFFIVLLGLIQALKALEFEALTGAMNTVLEMGAQIAFGAVIIFAGVFLARLITGVMASAGSGATDVAANVVKWVIITLSVILGISRMGLDPTGGEFILNVAEYLVIGGAAALAIAFGWGGKDWAAKQLESWRSTK